MKYFYDENDMLILEGISGTHTIADTDIFIGTGIVQKAVKNIRSRDLGKTCTMVVDVNTYKAAGNQLSEMMITAGFNVNICMLPDRGDEKIEADEFSVGKVMMTFEPEPDFLVACGSGVVNDITRFAAHISGKPFVSIGTAASMDGYTSVVTPMIYGGKKVHRKGVAPKVLILDTEILKNAPYEMTISGFGDVYGKYIAKADWLLSEIVNGEEVDSQAIDLITQALDKLNENVDEIKNATDKGLKAVIEGLILAGLTIFSIGHTRAVASVEHNQSHVWETRMLEVNKPYADHGIAVGCSTGYYLRMYEYFKSLDITVIKKEQGKKRVLDHKKLREDAVKCFGEEFTKVVEAENHYFRLREEEFEKQYNGIISNWNLIIKTLDFLPTWEQYRKLYTMFNYPISATEIGIPSDMLKYTLMYSSYYRDRYTFMYALDVLGVTEEITEKTLRDYAQI